MQDMSQCDAQDSQAIDQVIKLLELVKQGKLARVKPEPREWLLPRSALSKYYYEVNDPLQQNYVKVREVL